MTVGGDERERQSKCVMRISGFDRDRGRSMGGSLAKECTGKDDAGTDTGERERGSISHMPIEPVMRTWPEPNFPDTASLIVPLSLDSTVSERDCGPCILARSESQLTPTRAPQEGRMGPIKRVCVSVCCCPYLFVCVDGIRFSLTVV